MQYNREWIPPPPGRPSHLCNAVDQMWTGKRMFWAYCDKPVDHWEGEDQIHHYAKRNHTWDGAIEGTFFYSDFDPGRPTRVGSSKTAKKLRICKHCAKAIKTDGSPDCCVCKPTGSNAKQAAMFQEDRERIERELQAVDLAEDIALTEAAWHELEIAAEREAIRELG